MDFKAWRAGKVVVMNSNAIGYTTCQNAVSSVKNIRTHFIFITRRGPEILEAVLSLPLSTE